MKCYMCNSSFTNLNIFISHLTYQHNISDNYMCFQPNCHRVFNRKNAFKRHILLNHVDDIIEPNPSLPSTCSGVSESVPSKLETSTPVVDNNEPKIQNPSFDINSFFDILRSAVEKFISILYSRLTLNRSLVQEIISAVSDFFSSGIITIIKKSFLFMSQSDCYKVFTVLENPFHNFDTEHKRFKYFENSHCFVRPLPIVIGSMSEPLRSNSTTSLDIQNKVGYIVPMRSQLKIFLELPLVYKVICDYRNKILSDERDKDLMSNIMQGNLWQTLLNKNPDKNMLPLILYFDDFETCNPLGSHASIYKQGAVYFSIACLPQQYATKLENIFLAMLFHSEDRVTFGNENVFRVLINELRYLEDNGIEISCNGDVEQVYFSMVLLIGDNLGLHSLYGLVESFTANYYCRFCKSHKLDMQKAYKEDESLLRTINEYDEMVIDKSYGIKEKCIFNDLPNFHIFTNLTCDIMHDLTEGVHRYGLAKIIDNLISQNLFNLKCFNDRLKYFNYDPTDKNIPPSIKTEHIKNGSIILSSAEMMFLILNLRFIIGDLVPEGNAVWKYYLIMLEITEIVVSSEISVATIELLKTLIEEHNQLYVSLFKDSLKPKFHFLLHYHRVIKEVGPLCNIQSIRFEAKHKELKTIAHSVTSRKNLPLSLSLRSQLKFCQRALSREALKDESLLGPVYELSESDCHQFKAIINDFSYFCITWYDFNGVRYNNRSILINDIIDDIPQFYQIAHIIVLANDIFFIVSTLFTEYFNLHLRSYRIRKSNDPLKLVNFAEFKNNFPAHSHSLPNGEIYSNISKSF